MPTLLQPDKRWFDPLTLNTNAMFILVATIFLTLAGWLMQAGILPSLIETSLSQRYSPWNTLIPLKIWMQLAVVLSLILPIFVLLVCWREAIVRRMMLFYIGVMLVHILTEMAFTKLGLPKMNFIIGFIYTSYKLWQLWYYQQCITKEKIFRGIKRGFVMAIFVGGIVFWTLNWVFLGINLVTRTIGT